MADSARESAIANRLQIEVEADGANPTYHTVSYTTVEQIDQLLNNAILSTCGIQFYILVANSDRVKSIRPCCQDSIEMSPVPLPVSLFHFSPQKRRASE